MMETYYANANPEKRFFIDLITRDISLEDAILDMLDNAIDSLNRTREINLYQDLAPGKTTQVADSLPNVRVEYSPNKFLVKDNCGGISFESARDDVFRFGHPDPHKNSLLSVFGIGMKRAIFKIGRRILIESHSRSSGFTMDLDVDKWLEKPETNWQILIEKAAPSVDDSTVGTTIEITKLRNEVAILTQNPAFETRLLRTIQETYPFYLGKYVSVFVNKKEVPTEDLSFGESENIKPAIDSWQDGTVHVGLLCGLLPKSKSTWTTEKSGWYLLCNGRVIVHADKTMLTGWGRLLPLFMPKNRGFLGIVFFTSSHPEDLPWNTTKRGVNTESAVYIRTLKRMTTSARAVIQFQNRIFSSNDDDEPKDDYRESVDRLVASSATIQAAKMGAASGYRGTIAFHVDEVPPKPRLATISFKVSPDDLARVKKRLGRKSMSNREAGERIFRYYLDREC